MRREFQLPTIDRDFLDRNVAEWETVIAGGNRWVIIGGFDIPPGYNHTAVSVGLILPSSYPDVQIDMAYFSPNLSRADGKSINALSLQSLDGKAWQRWSRHRPNPADWRPGIDNIETHLVYVRSWLEDEFKKR